MNISHVNIENMGGCDQSQKESKIKSLKNISPFRNTLPKVMTMTLYAQWEHFDHMARFEEHYDYMSKTEQNLEQISNVPQNEPCDQNVPTGHIVRTF